MGTSRPKEKKRRARSYEKAALALFACFASVLFFCRHFGIGDEVHFPYDLDGFHYSLAQGIFIQIRSGGIPLWDASTYSGMPLLANIQAAVLYPPLWLAYLFNLNRDRLPYGAIELVVVTHVAISMWLFAVWLRERHIAVVPAVAGALAFAFGGCAMTNTTHLGVICSVTWLPLAFWGVDDMSRDRERLPRGLVKVCLAFALSFLAGYPASWLGVLIATFAYAMARRAVLWTLLALTAALGLSAAQILPTVEAMKFKVPEAKYSIYSGLPLDLDYYAPLLIPNLFNYSIDADVGSNPGKEYLYLGAFVPLGLGYLCLHAKRLWREAAPFVFVLILTGLFVFNPAQYVGWLIERLPILPQVLTDWHCFVAWPFSFAALGAIGLNAFLAPREEIRADKARRYTAVVAIALSIGWAGYLLSISIWHWQPILVGWRSVWLTVFSCLIGLPLMMSSRRRIFEKAPGIALLLVSFADLQLFGAVTRVNASFGSTMAPNSASSFPGINDEALAKIVAAPQHRVLLDTTGPSPSDLRHVPLSTPQGFDPFVSRLYQKLVSHHGKFVDNRHLFLHLDSEALAKFGVGFVITTETGASYSELVRSSGRFRLIGGNDSYFKVFEVRDPAPIVEGQVLKWRPDRRIVRVKGAGSGHFLRFAEQSYPGWRAYIDGVQTPVEACEIAFQCIHVPAGMHQVEFAFLPDSVFLGTAITTVFLVLFMVVSFRSFGGEPK